jgi:beta-galactosidase
MNGWQFAPYYAALHQRNIAVDFVPSTLDDLSRYRLVVVPNLYLTRQGVAEAFENYVAGGGTLIIGPFSGISDEDDHIWLGGYPAPFRKVLGIRIEEFDALGKGQSRRIITDDEDSFGCSIWSDAIDLEGARAIARFGDDVFVDRPAITQNAFGRGTAYYIGTVPDSAAFDWLFDRACAQASVSAPMAAPPGVEVVVREDGTKRFTFVLNHGPASARVALPSPMRDAITGELHHGGVALDVHGVAVLTPL